MGLTHTKQKRDTRLQGDLKLPAKYQLLHACSASNTKISSVLCGPVKTNVQRT